MNNELKFSDMMKTLKLRVEERSVRMPSGLTREQRRQWSESVSKVNYTNEISNLDVLF